MKIKTYNYVSEEIVYDSITEYAECKLAATFSDGEIESIKEQIENNSSAIGRLLDLLSKRKILSAQDLTFIVDDYANGKQDKVEFINE